MDVCERALLWFATYRSSDNDFSLFERPQHYIRYIGMAIFWMTYLGAEPSCSEPLESELAVQVEYDMDEQGGDC